jgi:hypothetical protein
MLRPLRRPLRAVGTALSVYGFVTVAVAPRDWWDSYVREHADRPPRRRGAPEWARGLDGGWARRTEKALLREYAGHRPPLPRRPPGA